MRVFLDSNVWVSGFAAHGLCADLVRLLMRQHGKNGVTLLLCEAVRSETLRIMREKLRADESDLIAVRAAMEWAEVVSVAEWSPPADFPDADDAPIIACALAAHADAFVTGDKPLLGLGNVEGLPILTPRAMYERLREAA